MCSYQLNTLKIQTGKEIWIYAKLVISNEDIPAHPCKQETILKNRFQNKLQNTYAITC